MVYRDWNSFQQALSAYNTAQASWKTEYEHWERLVRSFDRKKDKQGDDEFDWVESGALFVFLVAGVIVYFQGKVSTQWGWIIPFLISFFTYRYLDKLCGNFRKLRFIKSNPSPKFTLVEPVFEPQSQSYAPPPRNEPPPKPPQRNQPMTIENALSVLGLTRQSTIAELKRAYRDLIRQYHPDRVSDLGPELKELAESKAKEINAAHDFVLRVFQARADTQS